MFSGCCCRKIVFASKIHVGGLLSGVGVGVREELLTVVKEFLSSNEVRFKTYFWEFF